MRLMDEREENIVEAAKAVFSRYGVKRTTMSDIAAEAGIVRQTLYNAFPNKDEILRATIRLHAERSLAAIEAGCAATADLGDQLDIVFKHLVISPYDQVRSSPHADEIIMGLSAAAQDEIAIVDERYRAAVEALLAPYARTLRSAGLTPSGLADLVHQSWVGFKHKARNKKHLVELLASLKILVLRVAGDT